MRCTVIDARELTDADAAAWSKVQAANASLASPYFCAGWTRAVAAVRDDVRVAVIEDGGETVGWFPFQAERMRRGRPVGGPLSDYQGVVCARNEGWDARELVRGARLSSWEFDHLLCDQTPFGAFATATCESPVMDLSGGFDAYVEMRRKAGSKPFHTPATLRRKAEREVAPLRFESSTTDAAVLRKVFEWKSAQCAASGGTDVFAPRWTNEVVERLLHTRDPDGFGGVLSALWAGDQLFAAHFGMRSRTVWHYWFPVYNHDFHRYSPGILLLLDMAQTAQPLGLQSIDLGKGDADYKRRMRSRGVAIAEGRIELPSMASRLRRLRVRTEDWVKTSRIAAPARVPGRALKRFERWLRFR